MSNEYIISPPPQSKKSPFAITLAGITYEDTSYEVRRVNSDTFTMEYVISGKGHIEADGKTYTAEAGDTYLLSYGQNTRYYSDSVEPWRKIWFNAEGIFLSETTRIFNLNDKTLFHNINTLLYFEKILEICKNRHLTANEINMRCASIFTELVMFISNEINKDNRISEEALILKNYIDLHTEEHTSIKTLSKLIFKSESQTIRIFKNNFNITPYDYLLNNKINRAKIIIANTNLSIKETAYRLGFSDEHYFSNIFRKKTGVSPKEYRQQK